jgi:hypothetical protein
MSNENLSDKEEVLEILTPDQLQQEYRHTRRTVFLLIILCIAGLGSFYFPQSFQP